MNQKTTEYQVSDKGVYYGSGKIVGADRHSFQVLNETWAKDARHVYSVGRRVAKADAGSFRVLNTLYAKDREQCFYLGGVIQDADVASFRVLDSGEMIEEHRNGFGEIVQTVRSTEGFAADGEHVFHHVLTVGKPCVVRQADPRTFQILSCGFGRDARGVYFQKRRLAGADPASFEVVPPFWGKDRGGAYYGANRLPGADHRGFVVLSGHDMLATDGVRYYRRFEPIPREEAFPHGSSVAGYPIAGTRDPAKVRDYLARGATPHDHVALHTACRKGDLEVVELLLGAGCNSRITDAGRNSCLTELFGPNSLEIARRLVAAGADVNHQPTYSPARHGPAINAGAIRGPLQAALFARRFELADFLIAEGADVRGTTGEGERLIDYFRRLNHAEAMDYLARHGG